jgi:quinohemoprotein ethanol dehydrogenase
MTKRVFSVALLGCAVLALAACNSSGSKDAGGSLDEAEKASEALLKTGGNGDNWAGIGYSYDEQRFSPLTDINDTNVGQLGIAWFADLDDARGQEATPVVVDGTLYVSHAWSKVDAWDAATGKKLWSFDPKVPGDRAVSACCDVVNRGVAVWGDKLFVGTLDGRLIALDKKTGKELWSTQTFDTSKPYTITGAPRVVKDMVLIGNGGAEFGVRGYVTAYDADTGKERWRFYTAPQPDQGQGRRGVGRHLRIKGQRDLVRQGRMEGLGRRRHGVGRDRLRQGPRPDLSRRRQRQSMEPWYALEWRRRQLVPVLGRRARCHDRRL